VPEAVAGQRLVRVQHDDLLADRFVKCLEQRRIRQVDHVGQRRVGHVAPDDRGDPEHPLRLLREPRDSLHQHGLKIDGDCIAVRLTFAGGLRGEQLLGEERIPVRPFVDPPGEFARCRPAEDAGKLSAQLRRNEARQIDPDDIGEPLELGEQRQQWVAPMKLVRPERRHEQARAAADVPAQEEPEVTGRAIRPVQVFDDEHERPVVGEATERAMEQLEESRLRSIVECRAWGDCGPASQGRHELAKLIASRPEHPVQHGRVELSRQLSQRLDDRSEGQPACAQLEAVADEDAPSPRDRVRRYLCRKARLPDARFPADEHRCGLPAGCGLEGFANLVPLPLATDERRTG